MTPQTKYLVHSRTNENLSAIIGGLDMQPTDRIFACCGSGDLAFASLAITPHVKAVDNNPQQIAHARSRSLMLANKNYHSFFDLDNLGDHFSRPLNEKNIRYLLGIEDDIPVEDIDFTQTFPGYESMISNLDCMRLQCGDFFDILAQDAHDYNKIYVSNILTLVQQEKMMRIIDSLPIGATIYSSGNLSAIMFGAGCEKEFSRRLQLNQNQTAIARAREGDFWKPEVYVKKV